MASSFAGATSLTAIADEKPVQRMRSITKMTAPEVGTEFSSDQEHMQKLTALVRYLEPARADFSVNARKVPANVIAQAKVLRDKLIELGLDIQGITPLSGKAADKTKATKQRNRVKAQMQEIAEDLVGMLLLAAEDVQAHLDEQVRKTVVALREDRKASGTTGGIKKFERDNHTARFAEFRDADVLISQEDFTDLVVRTYGESLQQELAPPPALNEVETLALATEKERVNAQLQAWADVAHDAVGTNEIGTWGTSAGGAGGGFNISSVTAAVWAELRAWWQKKDNAWVTPSETSNWSLKKDRVPADETKSNRINYHINVA